MTMHVYLTLAFDEGFAVLVSVFDTRISLLLLTMGNETLVASNLRREREREGMKKVLS